MEKLTKEREEVRSHFHNKYYWNSYVEKIPGANEEGTETEEVTAE